MTDTENPIYVLLLKRGFVFVAQCRRGEEFRTAAAAEAGILGVFPSRQDAMDAAQKRTHPCIVVSTPPFSRWNEERKQS